MILSGSPHPLGANWDGKGVNFALFSQAATAVELCLFDDNGNCTARHFLPECSEGVWHAYLPGCSPGQHYGYRVHGIYDPVAGMHFNSHKLLIDPYAKQLSGPVRWNDALFGFDSHASEAEELVINTLDSAAYVPKAIVQDSGAQSSENSFIDTHRSSPRVPWQDTIIYELNVRGYTMQHPAISDQDRGRFRGLSNAHLLEYLKALGITSVELMPVHAFVDEHFLQQKKLHNYWGYNSINFFSPETRYLSGSDTSEFREMVNAIHDAGLEVILDVVYNHTAEGNHLGPTLSFRGIDNLTYYRTLPNSPGHYINDTGCGNTINIQNPQVQKLVHDSLRYWTHEMGVDGFRFDLAPILGRKASGYDQEHDFFKRLRDDKSLQHVKLIAEPWDIGPGGYQLGNFPIEWSEWNDKYRDTVRQFWRGDDSQTPEFAQRLHGSADLFEHSDRSPRASINFITSHDGYTLNDLVSYQHRHNEANGENNRDGHQHNYSQNYGVEGATDDKQVIFLRRRQRLNMLATLLLSQGTPMLLAGDEFGNSQLGNNNAYAQDNETGWIDWSGLSSDPKFMHQVQTLIGLRRKYYLLKDNAYRHGKKTSLTGRPNIEWFTPDGQFFSEEKWLHDRALMLMLTETDNIRILHGGPIAIVVLINAAHVQVGFSLPELKVNGEWICEFSSDTVKNIEKNNQWQLNEQSCACFVFHKS